MSEAEADLNSAFYNSGFCHWLWSLHLWSLTFIILPVCHCPSSRCTTGQSSTCQPHRPHRHWTGPVCEAGADGCSRGLFSLQVRCHHIILSWYQTDEEVCVYLAFDIWSSALHGPIIWARVQPQPGPARRVFRIIRPEPVFFFFKPPIKHVLYMHCKE